MSVFLPTFLLGFGQGMLIPALPLFLLEINGSSYSLVSLVVAAAGIGTVIADVPAGMLLERIGRKRAMMIGTISVAISMIGIPITKMVYVALDLPLTESFTIMIALRLIAGVGTALWGVSRMAFMTEATSTASRGRALSTFGGVNRIGTFAGPGIGGALGALLFIEAPFFAAAVLSISAAVVSYLYIQDDTATRANRSHKMRWAVLGGVARSHWRELITAGSAQVFAQMIRSGRQIIVPLYGASLGLDVGQIGAVISLSAAIDMTLFIPAGIVMDRLGRKWAVVPSFAIMGLGMALIPLATDYFSLMLATGVIGIGNGLSSGTMFTLGADLAPPGATSEFLGLWRFVGDMGSSTGPMVVGAFADVLGLASAAFALAFMGFLSATTMILFVKETLHAKKDSIPSGP